MKKSLLIVAIAGLAMASCAKDRTCTCTDVTTNPGGTVVTNQPVVVVIKDVKTSEIKSRCETSTEVTVDTQGNTTTNVNTCSYK